MENTISGYVGDKKGRKANQILLSFVFFRNALNKRKIMENLEKIREKSLDGKLSQPKPDVNVKGERKQ